MLSGLLAVEEISDIELNNYTREEKCCHPRQFLNVLIADTQQLSQSNYVFKILIKISLTRPDNRSPPRN